MPIFASAAPDWRTSFLIEYFSDTVFPRVRNMGYVAVRTARHKFIQYRELDRMNELYDLDADPFEQHNLIDRPDTRPTLERLQSELVRLLAETQFPASPPGPRTTP